MKKYKLNTLSVSGIGNKIHRAEDDEVLSAKHFPEGVAEELEKSGHLKIYTGKKLAQGDTGEEKKNKAIEIANQALKDRFEKCETVEAIKKEFKTIKELASLVILFGLTCDGTDQDNYINTLLPKNKKAATAQKAAATEEADNALKGRFGKCETVEAIKKEFKVKELISLIAIFGLKTDGELEVDHVRVLLPKNPIAAAAQKDENALIDRFDKCDTSEKLEKEFDYKELGELVKIFDLNTKSKSLSDYIEALLKK